MAYMTKMADSRSSPIEKKLLKKAPYHTQENVGRSQLKLLHDTSLILFLLKMTFLSPSMLIYISVMNNSSLTGLHDMVIKHSCHRHRAVFSSGTSHSNDKLALAL